jgi:hypothetical protein
MILEVCSSFVLEGLALWALMQPVNKARPSLLGYAITVILVAAGAGGAIGGMRSGHSFGRVAGSISLALAAAAMVALGAHALMML